MVIIAGETVEAILRHRSSELCTWSSGEEQLHQKMLLSQFWHGSHQLTHHVLLQFPWAYYNAQMLVQRFHSLVQCIWVLQNSWIQHIKHNWRQNRFLWCARARAHAHNLITMLNRNLPVSLSVSSSAGRSEITVSLCSLLPHYCCYNKIQQHKHLDIIFGTLEFLLH